MAAALRGVERVYLVTPSSQRAQDQQIRLAEAFVDAPPAAFADALRAVLPDWQVEGLLEDYAHYARGEAAQVWPTVPDLICRPARDVAYPRPRLRRCLRR